MLLILRRAGESLYIGSDIEVTVTSISKSRVMLGVTAPREISIRRSQPRDGQPGSEKSPPAAPEPQPVKKEPGDE